MLFNSVIFFFLFLPSVFFINYFVVQKWEISQILFLTISSLFFYGYTDISLVILLVFSLVVNGLSTHWLMHPDWSPFRRKLLFYFTLLINLGLLAFFKYAYLFGRLVLSPERHYALLDTLQSIPLPVGISFYTFQAISLIFDVYHRQTEGLENLYAQRNPLKFQLYIWFYIAFFPQLVAGPIVKGHEFMNQIAKKHIHNIDWGHAVKYIIIGYFLKSVIADNLNEVTLTLQSENMPKLAKIDLVLLLYGYSFQIFADFAGYSYIAIGLGRLFGYKFPINFNYPYLSKSISEFWRRWHISLSSWLKEYLYFSLGGNRKGALRTYVNLMITMFLGGLWHGAAWSYALWGAAHGILLAGERLLTGKKINAFFWLNHNISSIAQVFYTFNLVSVLWLLFKLSDFRDVIHYFMSLWENPWYRDSGNLFIVLVYGTPVVIYHAIKYKQIHLDSKGQCRLIGSERIEAICLSLMLWLIVSNIGLPGSFIYFQF